MSDVSIRLAGPDDAGLVASLLGEFRDFFGYSGPPDSTFAATVPQLLADPRTEFVLGGTDGVAQLRYRLSAWTGVEDCWLEDLFVRDAARGSGLGRALVSACFDRARERGCRRIELDVNEVNTRAIGLYVSCGFSLEPKGPGRTFFLSRKL